MMTAEERLQQVLDDLLVAGLAAMDVVLDEARRIGDPQVRALAEAWRQQQLDVIEAAQARLRGRLQ